MAHARTETLRDSQRRRLPFNLPPTGRRIDSKPGLEPLRDGDDVNLASESEEFGAANATNKDMRGAQTRTPARMLKL
ncbi:hypothetical protein GCK32_020938 [Trichostrongylus colubriformis]|uniref:Uncharacterized protein n=1 Tax=Trichostrongylus colubriformis TaxID=6319 RepID=A0AAN8FZH9_TRICO